jgi:hypothetical protein
MSLSFYSLSSFLSASLSPSPCLPPSLLPSLPLSLRVYVGNAVPSLDQLHLKDKDADLGPRFGLHIDLEPVTGKGKGKGKRKGCIKGNNNKRDVKGEKIEEGKGRWDVRRERKVEEREWKGEEKVSVSKL